jgi:UDP-N-acetylmuramate--alanine ligase
MTEPGYQPPVTLPAPPASIHFVGIGGIGMSGLARIFLSRGYAVSGSDAQKSSQTESLEAIGIPITIGHTDVGRAARADLVVATAAVTGVNAEIDAAKRANRPIVKRAAALGALANSRVNVAVAGSHGKSTTSGMITTALLALGHDPSYAVGAVVAASGVNASPGRGPAMVVEADEYDYSFLTLTPDVAVVTNVDYDHPDIFADQAAYDAAFCRFIKQIRSGGTLVMSADADGCRRLLENPAFVWPDHVSWFGESEGAAWQLKRVDTEWFVRAPDGQTLPLNMQVPGLHNALNAVAAVAALHALGISPADAVRGVAQFSGVGRRFEFKGEEASVVVVDDYSHHPVELRAALLAARSRYPGRRLWAVFQPHTYSRTKAFLDDWAGALTLADQVALLDIYGSRERDTLGVSSDDIAERLGKWTLRVATPDEAAERLVGLLAPGDVVLTIGAGDVTKTGPLLLDLLRKEAPV